MENKNTILIALAVVAVVWFMTSRSSPVLPESSPALGTSSALPPGTSAGMDFPVSPFIEMAHPDLTNQVQYVDIPYGATFGPKYQARSGRGAF